MPTSSDVYPPVLAWLGALGAAPHRTALGALAHLVAALLAGQDLRAAGLMRALLSCGRAKPYPRCEAVRRSLPRRLS